MAQRPETQSRPWRHVVRGTKPPPGSPGEPDQPARSLGEVVGGGMTWMVLATIVTKATTSAAQVVLGWKLSKGDFALFATATAITGFVMVCRDMGVRVQIIQQGRENYEKTSGPNFWLALTYNTVIAACLSLLALPLSRYVFHNDELPKLLWVMAMAQPIATVGGILQAKMRLDMRFGAMSAWVIASSIVRQASMIVLALMGRGAMSMTIPVLISAVFEAVSAYGITGDAPWKRAAEVRQWPALISTAKWFMVGSLASFAMDFGPYLVLAPLMGAKDEALGVFFFAFQITAQIGVLLSFNSQQVLLPALALLQGQAERQRAAAVRALHSIMLVGSLASLGLASIMAPMEDLFWHGKFRAATPVVIILGIFFPWRITFGLCYSILNAQGRYKTFGLLTTIEGAGLMLAALVAWKLGGGDPVTIAWWTGAWTMASRIVVLLWLFSHGSVGYRQILGAAFPSWVIAVFAGACGILADRLLGLGPWVQALVQRHEGDQIARSVADVARAALAGGVCTLVFFGLVRLLLVDHLRDALLAVPPRLRGPALKLLGLLSE